jgi:hypothetical protein
MLRLVQGVIDSIGMIAPLDVAKIAARNSKRFMREHVTKSMQLNGIIGIKTSGFPNPRTATLMKDCGN